MSNKKSLFITRLNISVFKIMGLIEEVADGLDLDSDAGIERVSDRFNTILYNLEEAFDTVVIETGEEAVERPQTFDEFIDEFMEEFDYEGTGRDAARKVLIAAISKLKNNGGGYVQSGGLKNGELVEFKLTVKNGTIRMELGDEGFYFEEESHHDYSGSEFEESDDDYEEHEDNYEEEESYQYEEEEEKEEEEGRCDCPMCDGKWMEEEENVHEEVNSILSYISSDIDELEKVIGNYFGNEKLGASSYELTEDDYALIRIYLIHVIEADRNEVNELTDRGLLAAWNYHLYIKNN